MAGEKLADEGVQCSNSNPPLSIVPAELISSCFFSSQICCANKLRIDQCKSGVLAAQDGLDCRETNATEFYTNCCEACKIGLLVGVNNNCSVGQYIYGSPFDDSYNYCCAEVKTPPSDTFYLHEGDESE